MAVTSYLGLVSLLLYAWHERGKPRKSYVVYWYGLEGPPQRETWHDWVDKQSAAGQTSAGQAWKCPCAAVSTWTWRPPRPILMHSSRLRLCLGH